MPQQRRVALRCSGQPGQALPVAAPPATIAVRGETRLDAAPLPRPGGARRPRRWTAGPGSSCAVGLGVALLVPLRLLQSRPVCGSPSLTRPGPGANISGLGPCHAWVVVETWLFRDELWLWPNTPWGRAVPRRGHAAAVTAPCRVSWALPLIIAGVKQWQKGDLGTQAPAPEPVPRCKSRPHHRRVPLCQWICPCLKTSPGQSSILLLSRWRPGPGEKLPGVGEPGAGPRGSPCPLPSAFAVASWPANTGEKPEHAADLPSAGQTERSGLPAQAKPLSKVSFPSRLHPCCQERHFPRARALCPVQRDSPARPGG